MDAMFAQGFIDIHLSYPGLQAVVFMHLSQRDSLVPAL